MKKLFILTILLLLLNSCVNCNTVFPAGDIVSEVRSVNYFEKISVSSGIQLIVYNGEQDVLVETYENIVSYVETYVRNNCLYIQPQNHISFVGNARIKVYVTAELIESVHAAGGAKVYIHSILKSDKLSLSGSGGAGFDCEKYGEIECSRLFVDISGGGKADLYVECDYLDAKAGGGAKLNIEGYAEVVDLNVSGGGKMEAYYLDVTEMFAKMSGGAYAEVNVTDYLSANLSGGSKIYYKGNPRIDENVSGGSKVIQTR